MRALNGTSSRKIVLSLFNEFIRITYFLFNRLENRREANVGRAFKVVFIFVSLKMIFLAFKSGK
jgi:hypothetical protein